MFALFGAALAFMGMLLFFHVLKWGLVEIGVTFPEAFGGQPGDRSAMERTVDFGTLPLAVAAVAALAGFLEVLHD